MCSQDPVEESTPHYHCKTAYFTNTVFDRCPVISSVTSFEKLPEFISVSVFEDVLESPVSIINSFWWDGTKKLSFMFHKELSI